MGTSLEAISEPVPDDARGLTTAEVSDALDKLGWHGVGFGLRPIGSGTPIVGRAFTVRCRPADKPAGAIGDYIDDVPPGSIIVIDNGGRVDCTVWGGILTQVAQARGVTGVVIHGAARDTATAIRLGYPLYARAPLMRTGKDRVQLEALNGPVSLGEVRVMPGDLVFADQDGVVAAPRSLEHEAVAIARQIRAVEAAVLARALAGERLDEIRRSVGYQTLQRPSS